MKTLQSLNDNKGMVVGQIYQNGIATPEIVVVREGYALSLNGKNSWISVGGCPSNLTIRPLTIKIEDVEMPQFATVTFPTTPNQ